MRPKSMSDVEDETTDAEMVPVADRLVLRPSRSYVLGFAAACVVPFALLAAIGALMNVTILRFSIVPVLVLNMGFWVFVSRAKVVIDGDGVELERAGQRLAWSAIRSIEVAPRGRGRHKSQIYVVDRVGQRSALLTWGPDWRHWHWTVPEVHLQLGRIEEWCAAHGIAMPPIDEVG